MCLVSLIMMVESVKFRCFCAVVGLQIAVTRDERRLTHLFSNVAVLRFYAKSRHKREKIKNMHVSFARLDVRLITMLCILFAQLSLPFRSNF
jgi:hypothetical protein